MTPERVLIDADVLSPFFSKKRGQLTGKQKGAVDYLSSMSEGIESGAVELYVTNLVLTEFLPGVWEDNRAAAELFVESCCVITPDDSDFIKARILFRQMFDAQCRKGSVTDLLNSFFSVEYRLVLLGIDGCYGKHMEYFENYTGKRLFLADF